MSDIPVYALYGETFTDQEQMLHWETIGARSKLHDFHIKPHRHEQFLQLLCLNHGSAEVTIDGQKATLTSSGLVVVPPLCVHSFTFTPDVRGHIFTIFARDVAAFADKFDALKRLLVQPIILDTIAQKCDAEHFNSLIMDLIRETQHPDIAHIAAIQASLLLVLIAVLRIDRGVELEQNPPNLNQQRARKFLELVDTHFRDTRKIDFYADILGISPTHLNRICRQALDATALSVIERRILLEAKRHLHFTSLSIKEIGAYLGYQDPAYFSRFFSQRTSMTPAEFRTMIRAKQ